MAVAGSVDGLTRHCTTQLAEARRRLDAIAALDAGEPAGVAWRDTFGRFDEVRLALANAAEYADVIGVVHPDDAMRAAAAECERRADAFETESYLDVRVGRVLARQAATHTPVSEERQRFIRHVLRDFERNGAALPPEAQARLRNLNDALTEAAESYIEALASPAPIVRVPSASLAGTSELFRRAHPPRQDGLVAVSADGADAVAFYSTSHDRTAARRVYLSYVNRGGEANVVRLEHLLALRHEKALLLGFSSWSDYVIAGRMAGSSARVREFLGRLEQAIAPAVAREFGELSSQATLANKSAAGTPLLDSERLYLLPRTRTKAHRFDAALVADYLDIDAVTRELFALAERLHGVTFRQLALTTWDPAVASYDVIREGAPIGRLFLDRFARPNKYPNPATFSVRSGRRGGDGMQQQPMVALVAVLPGPGQPVAHEQVVMYFHEFGHVLQQLLATHELASFSGTNAARDFVETPALLFEEWAWSRPVLERIMRHRKSKLAPPSALVDALLASRRLGVALGLQRQIFLAQLDLAFHSTPSPIDTSQVLRDVQKRHYPFVPVEGAHPQSSFSHLVGYDAAYYAYAWSQAFASDAWTRFASDGVAPARVAEDWRRAVLVWSGARDERAMLREFLGRETDERALVEFVVGAR